jgi:NADP-dependent 3-hydroxy acid dehydrogenase YdfG
LQPSLRASAALPAASDFQGAIDWLEGSKSQVEWLKSEDVAETIAFTVSLPKRVNLQQIAIMPTAQPS